MICDHDTYTYIQNILTSNLNTYACNYLTFIYVIETFMYIIKTCICVNKKYYSQNFETKYNLQATKEYI
jgi:hypothetical protein